MIKQIHFNEDARAKLKAGIDKLTNAVKVTLGAGGRTVIITRSAGHMLHQPFATKDGVTVARHVELEDEMEDTGAMLVRQASVKTAMEAGDGTTTACILTQALVSEGIKLIEKGLNPIELKKGIETAVEQVVSEIKKMAIPVELGSNALLQVANIAANNDSVIGGLIADTIRQVGKEGVISIVEGSGQETTVTIKQGLLLDKGLIRDHYITHPAKRACVLENPYILIYESIIGKGDDVFKPGQIFDQIAKADKRPLLIIAKGLGDSVANSIIQNHVQQRFQCCPIQIPGAMGTQAEWLEDIGALTGATICGYEIGRPVKNVKLADLGQAERVVINASGTLIYGKEEFKPDVDNHVEQLRTLASEEDSNQRSITERIARLTGGIAVVHVGGNTEVEIREKADRVDDAVRAVTSALEEGIVVGGGLALFNCSKLLGTDKAAEIVKAALKSPAMQIAENCGVSGSFVAEKLTQFNDPEWGYNARTGQYENLVEAGVIDAAKVVRCAIQNASSVAIQVLTAECLMTENRTKGQ